MHTVTSKHTFSAAHRLFDYNGRCERLHGHNYGLELSLTSQELDPQGMVLDFTKIKQVLFSALDEAWDHKTLLFDQDPLCSQLSNLLTDGSICPVPFNPTAEQMAQYLGKTFFPAVIARALPMAFKTITISAVTIFETEKNSATWLNG